MSEPIHDPPGGIGFLAGLDRDLRRGLAAEIRAWWTHHSTAIEGNTLTLGDTFFVLQEGLTVSGKPLKDHQEVVGHARAIDLLYEHIVNAKPVADEDLHALHRAVQTTSVIDIFAPVGRWKVESNGTTALLSSGVTRWHAYASVEDVPALMAVWLQRFAALRSAGAADLLDVYTDLHLGFTAIHPYAVGNGRLARLLANLPVLAGGQPPLLIPVERRRDYITRMGDWSVARGSVRPDQDLVPHLPEWTALRDFFGAVARPADEMVAAYRQRQAQRQRSG